MSAHVTPTQRIAEEGFRKTCADGTIDMDATVEFLTVARRSLEGDGDRRSNRKRATSARRDEADLPMNRDVHVLVVLVDMKDSRIHQATHDCLAFLESRVRRGPERGAVLRCRLDTRPGKCGFGGRLRTYGLKVDCSALRGSFVECDKWLSGLRLGIVDCTDSSLTTVHRLHDLARNAKDSVPGVESSRSSEHGVRPTRIPDSLRGLSMRPPGPKCPGEGNGGSGWRFVNCPAGAP